MTHLHRLLFVAAAVAGLCSSCAASRGFGQDLQKLGKGIESSADESGGAEPPSSTTATGVPPAY